MHTHVKWDPRKAEANLEKHGVDFASAALVLEDDNALTIEDFDHDEARFVSIGMDDTGRLLVVVHALGESTIRIISARKATKRERRQYVEKT